MLVYILGDPVAGDHGVAANRGLWRGNPASLKKVDVYILLVLSRQLSGYSTHFWDKSMPWVSVIEYVYQLRRRDFVLDDDADSSICVPALLPSPVHTIGLLPNAPKSKGAVDERPDPNGASRCRLLGLEFA